MVLGEAVGDGDDKGRVILFRLLLEAFERIHVAFLAGRPDRLFPSSRSLLALDAVGILSVEREGGGVEAQKTQRLLKFPSQAPSKGPVHLGDPLHGLGGDMIIDRGGSGRVEIVQGPAQAGLVEMLGLQHRRLGEGLARFGSGRRRFGRPHRRGH